MLDMRVQVQNSRHHESVECARLQYAGANVKKRFGPWRLSAQGSTAPSGCPGI